jgi:hypothetical protein
MGGNTEVISEEAGSEVTGFEVVTEVVIELYLYLRERQERASGTHWIGGWMDSRSNVDDME